MLFLQEQHVPKEKVILVQGVRRLQINILHGPLKSFAINAVWDRSRDWIWGYRDAYVVLLIFWKRSFSVSKLNNVFYYASFRIWSS